MRVRLLGGLTVAALGVAIVPAEAAWHGYVNIEAGFSFIAPGDVKTEKSSYRSIIEGQRAATVFRSVDDNIEYKVTVANFFGRTSDQVAIVKEASSLFESNKKVLADTDARIESSYGRKMTVDLPNNGGRSMAAVYFNQGYLIRLEVTALPPDGDYGSPDLGRFVDSLAFGADRAEAGATDLKLAR